MSAYSEALAGRAEQTCLRGWSALREQILDGCLVRFADGHTRRANSVTPLRHGVPDFRGKILDCEELYDAQGLPPIFRLPSFAQDKLDPVLDNVGYLPPEDETRVLYRCLDRSDEPPLAVAVELVDGPPDEQWLSAYASFTGQSDRVRRGNQPILSARSVPGIFARLRMADGRPASLVFGAVRDGIVCCNMVATRTDLPAGLRVASHLSGAFMGPRPSGSQRCLPGGRRCKCVSRGAQRAARANVLWWWHYSGESHEAVSEASEQDGKAQGRPQGEASAPARAGVLAKGQCLTPRPRP